MKETITKHFNLALVTLASGISVLARITRGREGSSRPACLGAAGSSTPPPPRPLSAWGRGSAPCSFLAREPGESGWLLGLAPAVPPDERLCSLW